ncbi:hypothetical protein [Streptomyces sp. NPDC051162]|uniref:hypothetical protein n=1 Tax=Streptomyces sp. NPDC051162 TaxID=3154747 RepID=UPI00344985FD
MNTKPRAVRLTDAQTGTSKSDNTVISLPHSPGWDGIVVGKVVDQCKTCTSLNVLRRAAWQAEDWDQDAWARQEFYRHWKEAHRV